MTRAEAIVAQLWEDPPDAAELRRRLKGPLAAEIRAALLAALASASVPAARWKIAADGLRLVGTEPIRDRLLALAADGARAPHVRAAAVTAALAEGPIPEADRDRIVEAALIAAFFLDDRDLPAIARAVADAGGRERVEHWRRLMGFTAKRVWGDDDDDSTPLPARAILSSPRGDGSFTVVFQADGPGGTITTAIVPVGSGQPRVVPLQPRLEAERLLEGLPGTFCALPAAVAAAIAPPPAPFDTLVPGAPPAPAPEPVDLEAARLLLDTPLCDDWAFTAADVEVAGIAFIPPDLRDEDWYVTAASALESRRARLSGMAAAMARFCALSGNPGAGAFAGLAAATEQDFASSPLVHVLLERAVEADDVTALQYGDRAHRDAIRARLGIEHATGRDLARLDLAEAAAIGMLAVAAGLPAWRRPRRSEIDALAEGLADRVLADFLADGAIEADAAADRFERGARDQLSELTTTVCSACRIQCWRRPDADLDDAYRSLLHPVLQP